MQTAETGTETGGRSSDRLLWGIVAGAIALMLAGFALLLVVREREPAQFPADTPQGVVQRYLQAQIEGRYTEAESYLSPSVLEPDGTRKPRFPSTPSQNSHRIVLEDTQIAGDRATVTVAITTFYGGSGGLFGGSTEYTTPQVFELRRESGVWKIIAPEYPIIY